jgi:predicted metal-dependent hydrolase
VKHALLLFALLGCSTLPEYAAPKGGVVEAGSLDSSDVISYRQLTRADFRGTHAPPEFAKVADRVGAATCGQVRPTNDTEFFIKWRQETPTSDKHHWVEVKKLSFMALMDRRCSWWNDKAAARAPAYVLEHEQIHFALYELGARKLNASTEALKREMTIAGNSQAEVESRAQRALNDALLKATEDLLERNRQFDEDTSLGYRPDRQRNWLKRVTEELTETQAHASPVFASPG